MAVYGTENLVERTPALQGVLDTFRKNTQPLRDAAPKRVTKYVKFEVHALQRRGGRLLGDFEDLNKATEFACYGNCGDADLFGINADGSREELCIFCGTALVGRSCSTCEN